MIQYPTPVPAGFKLKINDFLCIAKELKQIKFPKSKKKRIRKKWTKNKKNYGIVDVHKAFYAGDDLFVSSLIYEKLNNKLNFK
jgi:hypothetical protein